MLELKQNVFYSTMKNQLDPHPQVRKILLKTIYYQFIIYGCVALYSKSNSYRKLLNSAMYLLTKQIFSVRGNPWRLKLFEALNKPITEEIIKRRTRISKYTEPIPSSLSTNEDFQHPMIINYTIGTWINKYKWKKNWGEIADQNHLINEWVELYNWEIKLE